MPMIFVSNRARTANGLIFEPGYPWSPDQQGPVFDPNHSIPKDGEGLRVVDRVWNLQPGRFARYGGSVVNLAPAETKGSAAQKLEWVEWVRGNIANLDPDKVVWPPFGSRARTMRVQSQASEHLSGEKTAMLATYRDLRFTDRPFLDPEPTTPFSDYFRNVTSLSDDPDTPYLYFLETRPLVVEAGPPAPRGDPQTAVDIRDLYFRTTNANSAPTELFEGIANEIKFGSHESADGIGGLSVPDTHANAASRRYGVVGDATFNERRWPGAVKAKPKLQAANRLDFAAFVKASRAPLDQSPFDATRTPADRDRLIGAARNFMGFPAAAALVAADKAAGPFSPGLKLGDLFGAEAELIPGLRFADLFEEIGLAGSADTGAIALSADGTTQAVGEPLAWNVKLSGIEWLSAFQKNADRAPPLTELLAALIKEAEPDSTAKPLSLGMEATLFWSNSAFKRVKIGPAEFIPAPDKTKIEINASARIDLGTPLIEADPPRLSFSPGKPKIEANTIVTEFAVEIFSAIRLNFESISFAISPDGSKSFATKLASVELLPPLDFINQMQSMLGGLGGDSGMKVDISPQRAMISQTLNFPVGDGPLLIGPAQVTNLALSWAVTIPLMGRDVLSVAFGISSREKPLTIFVPPWYGGKAYILIEATTRGCRLIEISMEYGALIPINWGPARGEASLTAGIFYQLQRIDPKDSARVELTGFVKAASNLSVAGIIHFYGLIYISLSYIEESGVRIVRGISRIKVSVKIAFIRYSYTFTAQHEERQVSRRSSGLAETTTDGRALSSMLKSNRGGADPAIAMRPYGGDFSPKARGARDRLLAGYRTEGRGK
jgi:hypothetical protein